ncbi:hypothetical protein ABH973_006808 [Bradyrhizobium ottawaense]
MPLGLSLRRPPRGRAKGGLMTGFAVVSNDEARAQLAENAVCDCPALPPRLPSDRNEDRQWRAMRQTWPIAPSEKASIAAKEKPRRFPAGALCQVVRPNLPVALSAEEQGDGVLILQLVHSGRLGRRAGTSVTNRTGVLLVEMGPVQVSREREVLDRSPAGDDIPTWPMAKSGLQPVTPARPPNTPPAPPAPQSVVLASEPNCA